MIRQITELTDVTDIVEALGAFGIVSDKQGMIDEIGGNTDCRLYWLARKLCHAARLLDGKPAKNVVDEYESPDEIVWDLGFRGIVTDKAGMLEEMRANVNGRLYWLGRKGLNHLRQKDI